MKLFEVEYIQNGRRQKMTLKANSTSEARSLAAKNNKGMIVKIGETKTLPLLEQMEDVKDKFSKYFSSTKVKVPNLVAVVSQLSVMANAGISIHDSIKEIATSTNDKKLKKIFTSINEDLNQGASLTSSVESFKHELGDVTIAMIRLGENTGNMADSLKKLANILQEVWDNQQKFKKAIRYPVTVICAIIVAFTVMMLMVVPQFREIFEQLNAQLPVPTRILLGIEYAMNNYGFYIIALLIAVGIFAKKFYDKSEEFRTKLDKYLLKVYLIGKIIFYANMSRFNLIFTELVRAGIPIAEALDTANITVSNIAIREKLAGVKILVGRGVSLTEAFKETGLYENMLIQMINAGEQSGSIDSMLEKIADYYKAKFSDIIDNISSYIEPILLVFIACMVILLALGIFMPMWDLAQAVKN
ncbi:type II secretion system F family protein [Campylobacter sp. RM9344]|uniref:Type II secretion system F family protein n=1 Tax=Campylobacter californiensis TaxID=1032243 RepID=A0AAW3ZX69_9BACT|nr:MULTISPECIES: type II secretion system F family protein [unclassified Campylobacter]MBE2983734.1 type II secretion system F family protein [Campylobacter sp. RM6883]MBE2985702.1 type II secretion system F family protein [Campylobacter sp. RM12919]MBE2988277.1 type II secretion system F family protein [Campylobacter sp. RM12920]MBE2994273.1 type II secretion system F family protein [Campylobacter sp. RM6913]MBE3028581.1 type II secretion system F family protein [Campylobacter sp. RM9344]